MMMAQSVGDLAEALKSTTISLSSAYLNDFNGDRMKFADDIKSDADAIFLFGSRF